MPIESFGARLTNQRKSLGLSQKQASEDLGISQALLSHYENGVREPGLEFLAKAGEYYGVSCDYLLGRTNNTIELNSATHIADIPEDAQWTPDTLTRASLITAAQLKKDDEAFSRMMQFYSLASYLSIYTGVKRNLLPQAWLGANSLNDEQFKFLAHTMTTALDDLPQPDHPADDLRTPSCISTINTWINDYLNLKIADVL